MRGEFIKMHGLGNDFVVIDARERGVAMTAAAARSIADRREGIGCDQLILLEPSATADVRMRIWNADGGEVEACGNAARCVAQLLGGHSRIETAGGTIAAAASGALVSVEFPAPRFRWDAVPIAYPMDTAEMPVGWEELIAPMAVNVGNPHLVFFSPDCDAVDLARLGPLIEHDPLFPERINVNVATIIGDTALRLRVWERGSGLTRACGTGAVASAVSALRARMVEGPVTVSLPGGDLLVDWSEGGVATLHGPATEVYRGVADWSRFS